MRSLTITVICCTMMSPVISADDWTIEFVENSENIMFTSIAIGPDDHANISYSAMDTNSDGDLKYAYWNGSSWEITAIQTDGNVRHTSIALTSGGNPRIAYWDNSSWYLKYASWNGSSWVVSVVDGFSYYQAGPFCSLCIDSGNIPRIAYSVGYPDYQLNYARWGGSAWYLSAIDTDYGTYVAMALDSNDKPHVSYYDPNSENLKYAVLGSEFWSITVVDTGGDVGIYTSIAIDSNNRPHISYYDMTNGNLKYAYYNGSSWAISTVESSGDVGHWYTSIAVDDDDNPHISYYDYTNTCLKYASYNGSSWEISIVDNNGNVGPHSSLALDSQDQPHISYRENLSGPESLKYAYYGPVGIEEGEGGSVGCALNTIIPNPSAGSANVSFSLPVSCDVDLDVFDITGRKVAVLAEGVFSSGIHEAEISGLTSGIYFCTLRTGDFLDTIMLVVIR